MFSEVKVYFSHLNNEIGSSEAAQEGHSEPGSFYCSVLLFSAYNFKDFAVWQITTTLNELKQQIFIIL